MKNNASPRNDVTADTTGLVDAATLLKTNWHPDAVPSLRWLREQTARRTIPYIKIGHKVFFDPAKVRKALEQKFTVQSA
jgi:hypothetical protein